MTRILGPALLLLSSTLCGLVASAGSGTVRLEIARNRRAEAAQLQKRSQFLRRRSLEARDDTVTASLGNDLFDGLYYVNVSVGTPAQDLALQIDTGSSDTWIPSSDAPICRSRRAGGCPGGSFTSSDSSTFDTIEEEAFNISYVDGSASLGDYVQDTFSIGGATVNNFEMGLALDTSINIGIMGISYNTSEANTRTSTGGNGTVYANLPDAMVQQGLANSHAYSLWLNDLESARGNVLFGGIDTKKYSGDLISVQVYPNSITHTVTSFTVAWTALRVKSSSGEDLLTPDDFARPAILDSGTTITLLPIDIAQAIYEEVGASVSEDLGAIVVPCDLRTKEGSLDYQFGGNGGPTVSVKVSDLVLDLVGPDGLAPEYSNGADACQLGIQPVTGNEPILFGDTFLRSAYVVYDLANNMIALANTNFNESDSDVVAFESQGAAIPSASAAPSETAVVQTASGIPRVGETATATGSGQATYNPTATGYNAASGFISSATSTGKKKSDGGRLEPVQWSRVLVGGVSVALMGLGGGVFVFL